MKNTTKKALKAMLILTMLVTLCVALAACAQTTETGTTDPIVLELVNVGLDILAKAAIAAIGLAGAWATAKIGQNNKLANIKAAIGQAYSTNTSGSTNIPTDNGRRIAADYRRSDEGGGS